MSVVDDVTAPDPSALNDFQSASRSVLAFLRKRFGLDLWMVTRTEGDDWIVLHTSQPSVDGYKVKAGDMYRWADTFCSRMAAGEGPRVAPDSDQVPAYAAAPIRDQLPIKAYIGMPLSNADGSLFGTLCAIDPAPQPEHLKQQEDLIALLAALLSIVLQSELKAANEARKVERLEAAAHLDALTQLYNRRAWDLFVDREEERCIRYGHPAVVVSIDLDVDGNHDGHAARDKPLQQVADALRGAARESDIVARLGDDAFGVIAVECDAAGGLALLDRCRSAFARAGIAASIGSSTRTMSTGLMGAIVAADRNMLDEKRASKAR